MRRRSGLVRSEDERQYELAIALLQQYGDDGEFTQDLEHQAEELWASLRTPPSQPPGSFGAFVERWGLDRFPNNLGVLELEDWLAQWHRSAGRFGATSFGHVRQLRFDRPSISHEIVINFVDSWDPTKESLEDTELPEFPIDDVVPSEDLPLWHSLKEAAIRFRNGRTKKKRPPKNTSTEELPDIMLGARSRLESKLLKMLDSELARIETAYETYEMIRRDVKPATARNLHWTYLRLAKRMHVKDIEALKKYGTDDFRDYRTIRNQTDQLAMEIGIDLPDLR